MGQILWYTPSFTYYISSFSNRYELIDIHVSPSARLMYGEYWFCLSRLSMMVIGSFASFTKTKSVESAVWCLLTLDDDVETGNRLQDRNTWTWFRIRIVLFSFEQQTSNESVKMKTKLIIEQRTKINERLITNKSTTNNE
jgi:hypothetical protein